MLLWAVPNPIGKFQKPEETTMPLDLCHPNTPHKKLKIPEWYVSSLMMDRALDAVVRRAKVIDRDHDIPYLAGYSINGKTIYIDRHMPRTMKYAGREIDTDRYLILHEEVEKTLIDQLGLHYLHAHQIASRAEQAAVRAAGIRWRDYDRFMQRYVKRIGDERLEKVPADLDLKPYRDEHDLDLVRRMLASINQGKAPERPGSPGITSSKFAESPIAGHSIGELPHIACHLVALGRPSIESRLVTVLERARQRFSER